MTDGRVDVSVLIPVLNEERGSARGRRRRCRRSASTATSSSCSSTGAREDRTREILEELAAEDPRIRVLDNPARRTPQALNIGLRAARGDVRRADGRATPTTRPTTWRAGVERLRARRRRLGQRAAARRGRRARGRAGWRSRSARGSGPAAPTSAHAADEEIEVDSGFTGVWMRASARAPRRLGRGVAQRPGRRARRAHPQGGRARSSACPRWRPRTSRATRSRALGRQYHRYGFYRVKTSLPPPESLRRSHVLPPGLVRPRSRPRSLLPRPLRRLARAGVGLYALAVVASARARAGTRQRRCRVAAAGVRHDAPRLGHRLLARLSGARTARRRDPARGGPRAAVPALRRALQAGVARDDLRVGHGRVAAAAEEGGRGRGVRAARRVHEGSGPATAARTSAAARGARSRRARARDEPAKETSR